MKNIILKAIERRTLILCVFLLMAALGYYSWTQLSIEAYPDIADVTVQVVTQVPGLAAEEIEQQISIPLERELNGLPGLEIMRSKNTFGLSTVILVFKDGVDDYWARQRVQEKITGLALPYGAAPELNPLTSPTGEIFRYTLEGSAVDLRELTDLNKWVVIPRLKQIAGIADVSNFGGITTQFQIEIDPRKLEQYNVSLADVTDKIAKNNSNAGGSMLNTGELSCVIRGVGLVKGLDDLGKIVVKSEKGSPIYVNDLGTLKYGNLERKGVFGFSDKKRDCNDGVEGVIQMLRWQNPSQVLEKVHLAVDELNNEILPQGVKMHVFMDRTNLVDSTLHTVLRTLLEGVGLVTLVLILFLRNWRSAAVVAITIPLALLFAFLLMKFTDIPANLLSLGAIDFGIIVDGAIVMMETILKKREDHPDMPLEISSVRDRVVEVVKPIFFSTIIIITAYLPLFAFERIEKKLFTPMAFTVGYALLGALLVAIFLIPGLSYTVYRKPQKMKKNLWLDNLNEKYKRVTEKLIAKPKRVLAGLIVAVVGAIIFTMLVGKDFLPQLDEGSIWLQVQLPPGVSLERSKKMSDSLRKAVMKFDEVTYAAVQNGRDDEGAESFSTSHIECCVGLKPYSDWPSGKRKSDLIKEMQAEFDKMPGYTVGFSQPIFDMVMDQIAGAHSDLAVKVYGDNQTEARRIAEEVVEVVSKIKGAEDVIIDQEPPLPQLQIIANRDKIAQYGLNVSDVSELIEVAVGGKAVSNIFIGNKSYDIICRYNEESRSTPDKIGSLLLNAPDGAKIPLSQVADIRMSSGASTINRESNKRHLTVRINLRDIDLSAFLKEAQAGIDQKIKFDHDKFKIKWGGQFENQNRAYSRLAVIVPLALGIMFVLLYGAFGKVRRAAMLMGVAPVALFGGMLALCVRDMTLNVSSAVGFIALFGVAIQNGVIMISHINNLRKKGMELRDAVLNGAKHRLRPVLMTATVAVLGLLPASFSTDIGSDVQRPLATVIVYGLMFATIITLFALPTVYYEIEKKAERKENSPKPDDNATGAVKTAVVAILVCVLGFGWGTTKMNAEPIPEPALPTRKIAIAEYLDAVKNGNIDLRIARMNVKIAESKIKSAGVIPDPTFGFGWKEDRTEGARSGYGFNASLGTTIELGGKRSARIDLAESDKAVTQAQTDDVYSKLRADATIAYLLTMSKEQLLKVKTNSYEVMRKLASADSIRFSLGDIGEVDYAQSKLEAGLLLNDLIAAVGELDDARRTMNLLAGLRDSDTSFETVGDFGDFEKTYDKQELTAKALDLRPDIRAAKISVESARKQLALTEAGRVTDLGVSIGIDNSYSVPGNVPTPEISAGISIPLKFSNFNNGELEAAQIAVLQAEESYRSACLNAEIEIGRTYAKYLELRKRTENYRGGLLSGAEYVFNGKIYSYKRGETSLLEALTAQRTYNDTREAYYSTLFDFTSSIVELERAAGIK